MIKYILSLFILLFNTTLFTKNKYFYEDLYPVLTKSINHHGIIKKHHKIIPDRKKKWIVLERDNATTSDISLNENEYWLTIGITTDSTVRLIMIVYIRMSLQK